MNLLKIWKLSLEKYKGKDYYLKGNDIFVLKIIEGYLLFLLTECNIPVYNKDILLIKDYATYNDKKPYGRRGIININLIDKMEKLIVHKNDILLSCWKQYPNSYYEVLRKLFLLNSKIDLKNKELNLQEQILGSVYNQNLFNYSRNFDTDKIKRFRIKYNSLVIRNNKNNTIINNTIINILNTFIV